jgi:flavin-dependent dehydrogenase
MNKYKVIVIGAGPAGCAAANTIAKSGVKTALLEEHPLVGIPNHCTGGISPTAIPEITQELLKLMSSQIILSKYRAARIFSPSGKLVKEIILPEGDHYLIDRARFDQEFARQAINRGTDLFLNTRVTGLLRQSGKVIGVTTTSEKIPELFSDIVVAADGINAAQKGVTKWAGLVDHEPVSMSGVSVELTRVSDIEQDVVEIHTGAFTAKGWTSLWPRENKSCHINFLKMSDFELIKSGSYLLSKKLLNAVPVRIVGFSHPADLGIQFPKIVSDGLMLAGSAANLRGIVNSMASGTYAGEVAIKAVRECDIKAVRLKEYEELCEKMIPKGWQHQGYLGAVPFYNKSDEEIEDRLQQMIARGIYFMFSKR